MDRHTKKYRESKEEGEKGRHKLQREICIYRKRIRERGKREIKRR